MWTFLPHRLTSFYTLFIGTSAAQMICMNLLFFLRYTIPWKFHRKPRWTLSILSTLSCQSICFAVFQRYGGSRKYFNTCQDFLWTYYVYYAEHFETSLAIARRNHHDYFDKVWNPLENICNIWYDGLRSLFIAYTNFVLAICCQYTSCNLYMCIYNFRLFPNLTNMITTVVFRYSLDIIGRSFI